MLTSCHTSSKGQVTSVGFSSHSWCEPDLSTIHYWLRSEDLFSCPPSPSSFTPNWRIFGGVGITPRWVRGFLSALERHGFSFITGCSGPILKYCQHSLFNLITYARLDPSWSITDILYLKIQITVCEYVTCVRERDAQVRGKTSWKKISIFHPWNLLFVLCFTLLSDAVREVTSPTPPVFHFLWFLHLASSPSDSIQAGNCLLLTVINPRFETDPSPISIYYSFLIFIKTIIIGMKLFLLYSLLNLIRLRRSPLLFSTINLAAFHPLAAPFVFPSFSSQRPPQKASVSP